MLRLTVRSAAVAFVSVALCVGLGATPAFAVAPETTITSGPANGAVLLPGPVSYTFTSDQGGATFECSVDNSPFAACTSPATYDLPPNGHLFKVRAVVAGVPDATPAQRIWTIRNVPCEQAGEAYQVAQAKFFVQQQKLVRAKKQLHRAHSHGTAAQFQHAKNKVRHIKTKIKHYEDAMDAAIAQEYAVC
ncbi:MAG: large repetitive protein [Nocardioidaceae bacterium]|nr:large repetitive protein [Nocardioidaceae bacterium]